MTWLFYACLAALCVALSAFWAKAGAKKGDSALAAGIVVIVVCVVSFMQAQGSIAAVHLTGMDRKAWIFLLLSGIAVAGAMLCFFHAIQSGEIMHVIPVQKCYIVLNLLVGIVVWHEKATFNKVLAMVCIIAGTFLMILSACAKNTKWILYALGTTFLLCLSTFLEDYGVTGAGDGLVRCIKLFVALIVIWIVVLASGTGNKLRSLSFLDGIFLCLSGGAIGASWICYAKACALATEHMVLAVYRLNLLMLVVLATIFLKEKISGRILCGAILMVLGFELLLLKGSLLAMFS